MLVSFRKCGDYAPDRVKRALGDLMKDLGGAEEFFKTGSRILIKPNFLKDDPKMKGIITHPVLIRAVAELAVDGGCKVKIGDSPGYGSVTGVLNKSGFKDYFSDLPVEIVEFKNPVEIKSGGRGLFKKFHVDREIVDNDVVVNLPRVKTHGQMLVSLAVKNMFGAVVGKRKVQWHLNTGVRHLDFAKMLVELCYLTRPSLNIIDGIVGMEGEGPAAGDPIELGFLGACRDPLSLDLAVCRVLGVDHEKVFIFRAARELGYDCDFKKLRLVGDSLEDLKRKGFKLPDIVSLETLGVAPWLGSFLKDALTVRPFIEADRCNRCSACINQCPAKVMSLTKSANKGLEFVKIDYRNCIRCFCCQEICPQEAIRIRPGWLLKILRKVSGK